MEETKTLVNNENYSVILEELKKIGMEIKVEISKNIKEEMKELKDEIKRDIQKEIEMFKTSISQITGEIRKINKTMTETQEKTAVLEEKISNIEKRQIEEDYYKTNIELRLQRRAIKLRGVQEQPNEDLMVRIAPALAQFIDWAEVQLDSEIDKLYRVDSWVARNHNLPRDIMIFFTRERVRDLILEINRNKKFELEDKEVKIFKAIPAQILKRRRDYGLLTEYLKHNNIKYRWEKTEGVSFTFFKKRFVINTEEKMKDFLINKNGKTKDEREEELNKDKRKESTEESEKTTTEDERDTESDQEFKTRIRTRKSGKENVPNGENAELTGKKKGKKKTKRNRRNR